MRFLRPFALVSSLLGATAGCSGLLDLDVNTDPNAATEVSADLLFPTVLATIAANRTIELQPGGALFVNIFSANGSAPPFVEPERYLISSFTTGNSWGQFYTTGLKNLALIREGALEEVPARTNTAAQAEIVSAYIYYMLTTLWESVPFTQAIDGANHRNPAFDSQETVLRGIVDRLDGAIALIDPGGPPGIGFGDLMYGGDMDRWLRFANSLKLRTLMLIRNQDPSVDPEIRTLLSQPLIRGNADEAAIPFFTTSNNENNIWKLNNLYSGFVNVMNGNQFLFAGETLVNLMRGLGDPRLSTYFELAVQDFNVVPNGGGPATNEYFGQRAGVSNWNDGRTSMLSQNIIRRDWPSRILPAAEVWLYEAEFLALQGELSTANTSYRAGVTTALDYFDGKPGSISQGAKQGYLNGLPASFSTQAAALGAIHAQQYIEVLDRAPENWTQWRRTKFPSLNLPEQAVLGSVIRRLPMPPAEVSANPNAPSGIPLDQPMWFER